VIQCPSCGATYLEGTLFCEECGTALSADLLADDKRTDPLRGGPVFQPGPGTGFMGSTMPPVEPDMASGTSSDQAKLPPGSFALRIASNNRRQIFEMDKEILIGRLDSANRVFPDLDLTADGGVEGGVSRRHSRISFRDGVPYVEDLKSTNHTYLNDMRLEPLVPHPLRHGDELRLGSTLLLVELPQPDTELEE
jgi:hypothetical protein